MTGKILLSTFIFISGCAHSEPAREIANTEPARMTYQASTDGNRYKIRVETQYLLEGGRTFTDIVDAYRGVDILEKIGADLKEKKPKPMNKLRINMTMAPAPSPHDLSYTVTGYPKGWKMFSESTRSLCTDQYSRDPGKGSWQQTCVADLNYKATKKYLSAYQFESRCDERGNFIECTFEGGGTVEPIKVPGGKIVKALFGASDFTASEVACMTTETMIHSYSALHELFRQSPPYASKTSQAVDDYYSSPKYAEVSKLRTDCVK